MTFDDESHCPDKELIVPALAVGGDAFGLIINRHRPPLLAMACRVLGQREEAEDVLQEAFIQVHLLLKSFRDEFQYSTWLYTIALTRVRNRHRRLGGASLRNPKISCNLNRETRVSF